MFQRPLYTISIREDTNRVIWDLIDMLDIGLFNIPFFERIIPPLYIIVIISLSGRESFSAFFRFFSHASWPLSARLLSMNKI